jgi:hypothetical protein
LIRSMSFHSNPIQSNPIRSDPIQSNPIRSDPIRSHYITCDPITSHPVPSHPIPSDSIRVCQLWVIQCDSLFYLRSQSAWFEFGLLQLLLVINQFDRMNMIILIIYDSHFMVNVICEDLNGETKGQILSEFNK